MRAGETWAECQRRINANAERLESAWHYVYRAYDDQGLLLYIGCTSNLAKRMSAHRRDSVWYRFASDLDIETFSGRELARLAEDRAIRAEHSHFNRLPANQFTCDVTLAGEMTRYHAARKSVA